MVFSDEERKQQSRKRQKKYRANPKNKEKIQKRQEKYRANPENIKKIKERLKKYLQDPKNVEKIKTKRKEYRSNPDVKTTEKARVSSYNRRYYDTKKDIISSQHKIRYEKKRDEINKLRNITRIKKYTALRNSLIKILGGQKCVQCGFSHTDGLDIDHIHDTGNLDKKRFNRKDDFYRHYINHPIEAIENLQVLCANCNHVKLHKIRSDVNRDGKNQLHYIENMKRYASLRDSLFKVLGGQKCTQCTCNDPMALQIDHVHSSGNLDRKRFSSQEMLFRHYINHPIEAIENLQVLCANCNQIKARTRLG